MKSWPVAFGAAQVDDANGRRFAYFDGRFGRSAATAASVAAREKPDRRLSAAPSPIYDTRAAGSVSS